ncbi:MAG: VOC family protein [Patescibacteria group bacterium]
MIDHASVSVSNYEKSKELYEKMLAPLGYKVIMDLPDDKAAGYGEADRGEFWIGEVEKPAGVHIAFVAKDASAVQAFYDAALAGGALDNGAPGYRTEYAPGYYGAFVHDFDVNNVEAVWRDPSK